MRLLPRLSILALLICALCTPAVSAVAAQKEVRRIAMILFRGETPAEQGFRQAVSASAQFEPAFEIFDAAQSREKLGAIFDGLDPSKYDLIYTFGTTVTQMALQRIDEVPVVFNVVQRPIEAGIVASWQRPGGNATGASNMVSSESAFRTLALVLNIRKLGVIYYDKDPSPRYQVADIAAVQDRFGFRMIEAPVAGTDAIAESLERLVKAKVDAVMFPSDSFIKVHADSILPVLNRHRIPTIVVIPDMVKDNGAMLSLGPDYFELGTLAAQNALEILRGASPSELPVRRVRNLRISLNLRTADRLGVNFPLQLLSMATLIP